MDAYENAMVEARVMFANRINKLIKLANAENLGFFLIYYSALGSMLHQSMKTFLGKARKRCYKMGLIDLAEAFSAQARLETQRCREMKNDAEAWIAWWNQKQHLDLLAKAYLRHPIMPSMQLYTDLHKDIVKYQWPFAELAVVYELQRTQTIHSVALIKLAVFKLGLTALKKIGFVRRAARFDINQPLNKVLLTEFLKTYPETLSVMTSKAHAVLLVYADFIEDCFKLADNEVKKYQFIEVVD